MPNKFYNAFDLERLPDSGPPVGDDYRTAFQIDRDRILFSYAFRRLQAKTQVFQTGVYDYYRTRLTHSLEVGRVGCSLVQWLLQSPDALISEDFCIDTDLIEAIGFAHDIGHPPFGHIGERKLNTLMGGFGGFEGNAQTLRMLTSLIYQDGRSGMRPTRALLDGVMKYKLLRGEKNEETGRVNHFLYDDQQPLRSFVLNEMKPDSGSSSSWQSIECQIVDWADDITYSLHDIMDAIQTGYINYRMLKSWADEKGVSKEEEAHLENLLESMMEGSVEAKFSKKITRFVRAAQLCERDHPLADASNRYRFSLVVDPDVLAESRFYKRIAESLIFQSVQIQRLEFKGGYILGSLFDTLAAHYVDLSGAQLNLLSESSGALIRSEKEEVMRYRRLCDWIAGLTDHAACKLHNTLFDPNKDFGKGL